MNQQTKKSTKQTKNSKSFMPALSHPTVPTSRINNEKNDTPPIISIIKGASIGVVVYIFALFLLTLIFSVIAYARPDPNAMVFALSTVSAILSAIIGGIVSTKVSKESFLPCGIIFSIFMIVLSLLLSLFFKTSESGNSFWVNILLKLPSIVAAIFGAFIGSLKKKNTYPHKYR